MKDPVKAVNSIFVGYAVGVDCGRDGDQFLEVAWFLRDTAPDDFVELFDTALVNWMTKHLNQAEVVYDDGHRCRTTMKSAWREAGEMVRIVPKLTTSTNHLRDLIFSSDSNTRRNAWQYFKDVDALQYMLSAIAVHQTDTSLESEWLNICEHGCGSTRDRRNDKIGTFGLTRMPGVTPEVIAQGIVMSMRRLHHQHQGEMRHLTLAINSALGSFTNMERLSLAEHIETVMSQLVDVAKIQDVKEPEQVSGLDQLRQYLGKVNPIIVLQ